MVRCIICFKNEATQENLKRFHHFYCDACVDMAAREVKGRQKQE